MGAAYWSSSTGWIDLLPSSWTYDVATGASFDGRVIVGFGNELGAWGRSFRWEQGLGVANLGVPSGMMGTYALAVSANGQVVVGYCSDSNSRKVPFRWTAATGIVLLTGLQGSTGHGEARAVSADGAVVSGLGFTASSSSIAFRWTANEGMQRLPDSVPESILFEEANAMTPDGSMIFGGRPPLRWRSVHGSDRIGWEAEPVRSCTSDGLAAIISKHEIDVTQSVYLWRSGHDNLLLRDYLEVNGVFHIFQDLRTGLIDDAGQTMAGMATQDSVFGWTSGGWIAKFITSSSPPTANADYYRLTPNTELVVPAPGVLANDLNPIGLGLRAELVWGPSQGYLEFREDGSFTYFPEYQTSGLEHFIYRIFDGINYSAPVEVTLDVRFRQFHYQLYAGIILSDVENHGVAVGGRAVGTRWEPWGPVPAGFSLGGDSTFIEAINNFGDIVGWGKTAEGAVRAFVRIAGSTSVLPTLGGTESAAYDINDAGVVVGEAELPSGRRQAVLWRNGIVIALPITGDWSRATGVSSTGTIVGVLGSLGATRAWTWSEAHGLRYLTGPWTESFAESVDYDGVNEIISGATRGSDGRLRATTWLSDNLAPTILATPESANSFSNDRGDGWYDTGAGRLVWPIISPGEVVLYEESGPYPGIMRSIERRSSSSYFRVVLADRAGQMESIVLFRRVPEEWERTRGIGDASISNNTVEGGDTVLLTYQGDPWETISLEVASGNPALVEFSNSQRGMSSTVVTIRTLPVTQNVTLQIHVIPDFSFAPPLLELTLTPRRARLAGLVTLQAWLASPSGQAVRIDAIANHEVVWSGTTSLDGQGAFSILRPDLPEGLYTLRLKANHWLSSITQPFFMGNTGVSGIALSLRNGDVDADNEVSIGDYAILSNCFGSSYGDPQYSPPADLSGDDTVDILDFAILSANYGELGE